MTPYIEGDVETENDFREVLTSLLIAANENDISFEGGWDCRNGDEVPDWDVVISEVKKPSEVEQPADDV